MSQRAEHWSKKKKEQIKWLNNTVLQSVQDIKEAVQPEHCRLSIDLNYLEDCGCEFDFSYLG